MDIPELVVATFTWKDKSLFNAHQDIQRATPHFRRPNDWIDPVIPSIQEERASWRRIHIPSTVTNIHNAAFYQCRNVLEVVFENEEESQLQRIGQNAFNGCGVKRIKFPRHVNFKIGANAFWNSHLESVFLPENCVSVAPGCFFFSNALKIVHFHPTLELGSMNDQSDARFGNCRHFRPIDNGHMNGVWNRNIDIILRIKHNRYELHRNCTRENPSIEVIVDSMVENNMNELRSEDLFHASAVEYLSTNPYKEEQFEMKVIKKYVLRMMGEVE
ncbi:hypothetical protein CTEN210_06897 [Chaetoceros tenuissimus]|uniref:Uncharacterized protein n=1 Tax=Chaetoceros tenuissimus TaxID=426638 RepID=A0AAD3CSJ6_9STRA|nr:hypothetical protein CTEN210_06897 [Chaetoceros tenuissimus]